jgi:hypothetical protein
VDRNGLDASPRSLLTSKIRPNEVRLPVTASHHRQFIDCVLTRQETLTPARVALRSATPGWLGVVALRTGRVIRWDPAAQAIVGDRPAERVFRQPMRSPWAI